MVIIATGKEADLWLFYSHTKYGSDHFRQIFIDHWERWWDYRDLDPAKPFDKISSVGMVEHIGRSQLAEYFQSALTVLKPGGLFLNHAIGPHRLKQEEWLERTFPQAGGFLQKYVFPDGELLNINEMLASAETSGFEVRDLKSLREHYALTLRHWIFNLEAHHDQAVRPPTKGPTATGACTWPVPSAASRAAASQSSNRCSRTPAMLEPINALILATLDELYNIPRHRQPNCSNFSSFKTTFSRNGSQVFVADSI